MLSHDAAPSRGLHEADELHVKSPDFWHSNDPRMVQLAPKLLFPRQLRLREPRGLAHLHDVHLVRHIPQCASIPRDCHIRGIQINARFGPRRCEVFRGTRIHFIGREHVPRRRLHVPTGLRVDRFVDFTRWVSTVSTVSTIGGTHPRGYRARSGSAVQRSWRQFGRRPRGFFWRQIGRQICRHLGSFSARIARVGRFDGRELRNSQRSPRFWSSLRFPRFP